MKILHCVEFYSPSVGGAQEVVKQLSEHLVELGHNVTVATTKLNNRKKKNINGVKIIEFDIKGNEVRGYHGSDLDRYKKLLADGDFDIIMSYAAQQWTTDLMFQVIDQIKSRTVLVPCGYSGLHDSAYKDYFHKLPGILKKFSATVYLSNDYRDINYARDHKLDNIVIIPNGADEREFVGINKTKIEEFRKKYRVAVDNLLILNVSNHTGAKGHRETIRTFQQAKIKNTTLMLIGDNNRHPGCYNSCKRSEWLNNHIRSKLKQDNKSIIILNMTREETIVAFHACDIFLFLSNIECSPLVLFESAAAGKPFISSRCGNAKEIVKWTGSGIVVNSQQNKYGYTMIDIDSSVKAIEKLANNQKLRRKMGEKGRMIWKSKYSWQSIAEQYENLYIQLSS